MLVPTRSRVRVRQVLLTLLSFLAITALSQDVNTRFRIEAGSGAITRTGNMGGSCDDIDMDLAAVYSEAVDMARVAVTAMNNYASDATVRASLFTFFGIQEDAATHTVSAGSVARFAKVKQNFQTVIDDSRERYQGLFPSLFCSEKWRWRTRWLHNRQTGKPTGQLIKSVHPTIEWLAWSPRFKTYGADTIMCQGDTMAFTSSQEDKLSITLCPRMFSYARRKDTLQPWRSGQRKIADGTNMAVALSSPATFLHELMHLTTRSSITDEIFEDPRDGKKKTAYGPVLTGYLAQMDATRTVTNADNYAWFATAMYLTGYDWSRVIAGKRVSQATTRRSFFRAKPGNDTVDTEIGEDIYSHFPWDD